MRTNVKPPSELDLTCDKQSCFSNSLRETMRAKRMLDRKCIRKGL